MAQKLKVHELLSSAELAELEQFAREPGRTIDECHEWLQAHGFTLSRNAVWNWKSDFDELVLKERFSRSADLARAIGDATKNGDAAAIARSGTDLLAKIIFDGAAQLEAKGEVDPVDVLRWTRALKNVTATVLDADRIKAERDELDKRAIEEASKVAQGGGDGSAVVNKVREILGMGV